ncbi:MAG: DUF6155 family protein [Cyanobacteria bacterium J06649_5]
MSKFTLSALKKQLSQKTKTDLVAEIAMLCKTFPQVKEYYQGQGADVQDLIKKYKGIIEKEFILGKTKGLPSARFSVARKALNDFKKLTKEPALIADMMLFYVECASSFNTEFAPDAEKFYTGPENLFETTLAFIKKHQLKEMFRHRAYEVVANACDGWGHQESLADRYLEVYSEDRGGRLNFF